MAVSGIDNQVIGQICIIVRDVEATAQRYAEILGFDAGDFQVTEAARPDRSDLSR